MRTVSLVLVALVLGLTGCGKQDATPAPTGASRPAGTTSPPPDYPVTGDSRVDALLAAIEKKLPADWVIAEAKHGKVEPCLWESGTGWHVGLQTKAYRPPTKQAQGGGVNDSVDIWIMDEGYSPTKAQYDPAETQSGCLAEESGRWNNLRAFILGDADTWKTWQKDVVSCLEATANLLDADKGGK